MSNQKILKDRYKTEEDLGNGAFGKVFVALDTKSNEKYKIFFISFFDLVH